MSTEQVPYFWRALLAAIAFGNGDVSTAPNSKFLGVFTEREARCVCFHRVREPRRSALTWAGVEPGWRPLIAGVLPRPQSRQANPGLPTHCGPGRLPGNARPPAYSAESRDSPQGAAPSSVPWGPQPPPPGRGPLVQERPETLRRDHRAAETPPAFFGPLDAPENGSARLRGARPADGSARGAGLSATGLLRPHLARTNGGGLFTAARSAAWCLLRRRGKGQELGGRSHGKSSVDPFLSLPLLFLGEIPQHPVSELHLSSIT